MIKHALLLFLFLLITSSLAAQVLPKEGSRLNYRLIGFSFPAARNASEYKMEVAAGDYYAEDSFKKNIVVTINSKNNKAIGEVPSFNTRYTWRIICTGNDPVTTSQLYHFSTGIIPQTDTSNIRLRITKTAEKYKDAYVFADGSRALYDMSGHPVWYLPYIGDSNTAPRDLKLSPQGTITFLLAEQAYEVNCSGAVLWTAPNDGRVSGDFASEHYHHEFTRLANGHYMILGNDIAPKTYPGKKNNTALANDKVKPFTSFGTIIEYDEKNNIVWSWKCSKYFMNSDIDYYQGPDIKKAIDVHQNAFFFDENAQVIYIGFKNISRILKVKYPEGTVMNVYGELFQPDVAEKGNNMFCGQHSCGVTRDGDLYVFNNNDCGWPGFPSIVVMQQPANKKDSLKKIWEFTCNLEGMVTEKIPGDPVKKNHRTAGGNAIELPDGSMFASLCAPNGNMFIVNRNKEILWSAIAEKWNAGENKWAPNPQYRASIVTNPKDLERLIWNQEQK